MVTCNICGATDQTSAFCANCGTSLTTGTSAPAAPALTPTAPLAPPADWNQLQPSKSNDLAKVALVAGIVGFVTSAAGSLVAVVCGHIALAQIKKNNQTGRGQALAGLIMGYAMIALIGVIIIAFNYAFRRP